MANLIDAWVWIEYFKGTKCGELIDVELAQQENLTPESALAEVYLYALKAGKTLERVFDMIYSHSKILPIKQQNWLDAAEFKIFLRKTRPKFGLMDALLLAKQRELGAKIVTGDPHFKGMKNVLFVG